MNTNACAPSLDASIAFALLAAGSADRFGSRKLLADLGGRPLWRWAAANAERAGFKTRLLIVPASCYWSESDRADGWSLCVNSAPEEGMASSIRVACEAAGSCHRLVIALADMPFIEPSHLRRLAVSEHAVFTRYPNGRNGVPASFPRARFGSLATIQGDRGAGALAWAENAASMAPASHVSLMDIDTANDLARARKLIDANGVQSQSSDRG